jgi:hypothetical protein
VSCLVQRAMLIFSVSFQADQMPEGGGKRSLSAYKVGVSWKVALDRVDGLARRESDMWLVRKLRDVERSFRGLEAAISQTRVVMSAGTSGRLVTLFWSDVILQPAIDLGYRVNLRDAKYGENKSLYSRCTLPGKLALSCIFTTHFYMSKEVVGHSGGCWMMGLDDEAGSKEKTMVTSR